MREARDANKNQKEEQFKVEGELKAKINDAIDMSKKQVPLEAPSRLLLYTTVMRDMDKELVKSPENGDA